jgi:mannosyltransferase OCH1-like enzyme
MIPKVFHQYWTDPRGCGRPVPADVTENSETWTHLYPEFAYSLWTDETLPALLSDVGGLDVWSHAKVCRLPAMRADIVRLGLVFHFGGFWVDLKNQARKRIPNDLLEHAGPVFVEHPGLQVRTIPKGFVSNSFFGAPAESTTVLHALQLACANVALRIAGDIFETTGPSVLNAALRENHEAVRIVRHPGFWGVFVERTTASYNDGEMHWSERQQKESLYW